MEQKFLNIHDNHLGQINTASGKLIDFNNPTVEMICEMDIANALAKITRFGGHTHGYWSVGQHSLLVAALAPSELKLEALCHDAAEAYLGDVVKPLKNILGEPYAKLERDFMAVIAVKLNLGIGNLGAIKPYDVQALEMEYEAFVKNDVQAFASITGTIEKELGYKFFPWQVPTDFLRLFKQYAEVKRNRSQFNHIPQL